MPAFATGPEAMTPSFLIAGIVAACLLIYLVIVLLRPERF
jgi:K+-transporting ATPase KdpF subunit